MKEIFRKIYDAGVMHESTLHKDFEFEKAYKEVEFEVERPKENVLLKTQKWEHTCHAGCCYTTGTSIFINNKKVTAGFSDEIDTILEDVLKYLGFEVHIDFNHNVEEAE